MTVDVLSKLNTSGSGLNIAELSRDLAGAAIDPRRNLVSARVDKADLSVSAFDRLRLQMQEIGDTLTFAQTLQTRTASSDRPQVAATLRDPRLAPKDPISLEVKQIAQTQVLEFAGFSSADTPVGQGQLTVNFGTWSGEPASFAPNPEAEGKTITFQPGTTLSDVARALNSLDGVSARVIDLGDGNFALGVNSATGAANALRFSVSAGADAGLAALDFAADNTPVQRRAASDARLLIDGIAVTRQTNQIDDLVPGLTLDVSGTTPDGPARISAATDPEMAVDIMQTYVDMFNQLKTLMSELTAKSGPGPDDAPETGVLSGNVAVAALQREFDSLLTRGLEGFGDRPVYMSDLGVQTQRDGKIVLNESAFRAAFAEDPGRFEAILRDGLQSPAAGLEVTGRPTAAARPGTYDFRRDPDTGAATLDGVPMTGRTQADGTTLYTLQSGPMRGLRVTVAEDVTQTSITFGRSLSSVIADWADAALSEDGSIARNEARLREESLAGAAELQVLDGRATEIEQRYMARFTAMERIITQLNATGDYLTSLIDGWNARN